MANRSEYLGLRYAFFLFLKDIAVLFEEDLDAIYINRTAMYKLPHSIVYMPVNSGGDYSEDVCGERNIYIFQDICSELIKLSMLLLFSSRSPF